MSLFESFTKKLKESDDFNGVKVFMNTWKNYNRNEPGGAVDISSYGYDDGWMTPEEGLKFCEVAAEDEPFIADIDNYTGLDLNISNYDNPVSVLKGLVKLNEIMENGTNSCSAEDIPAVFEAWSDHESKSGANIETINEFIDFLNNGEYYVYANVTNDYDLGKNYVDMVGGILFVGDVGSYLDKEQMKEDYQEDVDAMYDENDPEWYEVTDDIIDEDIASVVSSQNAQAVEDAFSQYFNYEDLGEELDSNGSWYFVSGDKCVEIA